MAWIEYGEVAESMQVRRLHFTPLPESACLQELALLKMLEEQGIMFSNKYERCAAFAAAAFCSASNEKLKTIRRVYGNHLHRAVRCFCGGGIVTLAQKQKKTIVIVEVPRVAFEVYTF